MTRAHTTYEEDGLIFDGYGRMMYHPEFHENHGKAFTESDLEYMCKYYEVDEKLTLSMALGKTEKTIAQKVSELRKAGLYEYYKNLNKHW